MGQHGYMFIRPCIPFRGRSCTQPGSAKKLAYFLCPLRSLQTRFTPTPHSQILSQFIQGYSLSRVPGKAGLGTGESQTSDSLQQPQGPAGAVVSQPNRGPWRKRKPALGVVRRSRGGRGVPGSGHPAGACAPRACGAGWAPGGTLQAPASVYQQTAIAQQLRIPTR